MHAKVDCLLKTASRKNLQIVNLYFFWLKALSAKVIQSAQKLGDASEQYANEKDGSFNYGYVTLM